MKANISSKIQFEIVNSQILESFRKMQVKEIKAQVQDFVEEAIITYNADFVSIKINGHKSGYACIGTFGDYKNTILEYYITIEYRCESGKVVKKLAEKYDCKKWLVNTHDYFTLPLMLDLGLEFKMDGYIFSINDKAPIGVDYDGRIVFGVTKDNELNEVYDLIMQDDFYTGGDIDTVERRIAINELYSLRENDNLVGVGFVGKLSRTPKYADIAMVIDGKHRRKGLGELLVKDLIVESLTKNLVPTAVTDVININSRKTLEKAGFYLDGLILMAQL